MQSTAHCPHTYGLETYVDAQEAEQPDLRDRVRSKFQAISQTDVRLSFIAAMMGDDLHVAFLSWLESTDEINVREGAEEAGL